MSLLWKTALSQIEGAKSIPSKAENIDEWMYQRKNSWYPTQPHEQTLEEFKEDPYTFWHGSPNGVAGMKQAHNGIHVGSEDAAREALNARIGTPARGDWDGTREYGQTPLRPGERTGYAAKEHRETPWPEGESRLPSGRAEYSDGTKIPMDAKPSLFPVHIVGSMTNTPGSSHQDWHANGYMQAQIKQGRARNGYYYRNIAEDAGSISAVVPTADHLATHEDFVRHVHQKVTEHNTKGGTQHHLTGTIHPENLERYGLS